MFLKDLLGLNKSNMISIVGAGGKTTLMFSLAEELRQNYKVLVTTTTKIYIPHKNQYDFIYFDKNNFRNHNMKGICVFASYVNKEGKIFGLKDEELEKIQKYFDFTLVEADGSKRKQIKGWNCNEPVVCKKTNKTVGVLDIQAIGKSVNDDNVHRVKEFIKITNAKIDKPITTEQIVSLICHPQGLFKNALGEKILFINKAENEKYSILARELVQKIIEKNFFQLNKIIMGSLRDKRYQQVCYN